MQVVYCGRGTFQHICSHNIYCWGRYIGDWLCAGVYIIGLTLFTSIIIPGDQVIIRGWYRCYILNGIWRYNIQHPHAHEKHIIKGKVTGHSIPARGYYYCSHLYGAFWHYKFNIVIFPFISYSYGNIVCGSEHCTSSVLGLKLKESASSVTRKTFPKATKAPGFTELCGDAIFRVVYCPVICDTNTEIIISTVSHGRVCNNFCVSTTHCGAPARPIILCVSSLEARVG